MRLWPITTWVGLGLVLLGTSDRVPRPLKGVEGRLCVLGLALAGGSIAWAAYSIICPTCRTRVLLLGAKRYSIVHCFRWLMRIEVCPVCGGADQGTGS